MRTLACPTADARDRQQRVNKRTLCLAADLVTLQGKLAISCAPRSSVPGMCRAQIGCAMNVPWCGWGEGWQALQVFDYKAPRASDNGLKIRVSVVRFRPWPPLFNKLEAPRSSPCLIFGGCLIFLTPDARGEAYAGTRHA